MLKFSACKASATRPSILILQILNFLPRRHSPPRLLTPPFLPQPNKVSPPSPNPLLKKFSPTSLPSHHIFNAEPGPESVVCIEMKGQPLRPGRSRIRSPWWLSSAGGDDAHRTQIGKTGRLGTGGRASREKPVVQCRYDSTYKGLPGIPTVQY